MTRATRERLREMRPETQVCIHGYRKRKGVVCSACQYGERSAVYKLESDWWRQARRESLDEIVRCSGVDRWDELRTLVEDGHKHATDQALNLVDTQLCAYWQGCRDTLGKVLALLTPAPAEEQP